MDKTYSLHCIMWWFVLDSDFSLFSDKSSYLTNDGYPFLDEIKQLSEPILNRIYAHQDYFIKHPKLKDDFEGRHCQYLWGAREANRSFNYILSGDAYREYKDISELLYDKGIEPAVFEYDCFWSGDNSLISVNLDSVELFEKKTDRTINYIDFFEDEFPVEAHSLIGIQLWRCFVVGHDCTWY